MKNDSGRDRKHREALADQDIGEIWQNCQKYRDEIDETDKELQKLNGDNNGGYFGRFMSSKTNKNKVTSYTARLRQMRDDLFYYLRRCLTDDYFETKQCLNHMSSTLAKTESEVLIERMDELQGWQERVLRSLHEDGAMTSKQVVEQLKELNERCLQLEKECAVIEGLCKSSIVIGTLAASSS